MTSGHLCVIFISYSICGRDCMDMSRWSSLWTVISSRLWSEYIPNDTGIMRVLKQNLWRKVMDGWQPKNEFHTPLGYFNIVHINMTSTGPKCYVRFMQDSCWGVTEWGAREQSLHLNMPSNCQPKSENYYCTAPSHVWKGVVMACHLQLLGSNGGMGEPAMANFICTGFFPSPNLSPRPPSFL